MSNRTKTYSVYIQNKISRDETYVSTHKREKDAIKAGTKTVNARSTKKYSYNIKVTKS